MTFSQHIAGTTIAYCTLWLIWALLAPVIAGPVPMPKAMHTCPAPVVKHGVGSDLKTYTRTFDQCAELQAGSAG